MILNCFTPSRTNGIIIISKVGERYLITRSLSSTERRDSPILNKPPFLP